MQDEIDATTNRQQLQDWRSANKERMALLHESWEDELHTRAESQRLLLIAAEARAAQANGHQTTNGNGKSANGKMPNPANNIEEWLKWLDEKLGTFTDGTALETYWNDHIMPVVDQLFPPDQEAAYGLYRRHEERLAP